MPQINWGELARITEMTNGASILRDLDSRNIDSADPKAVPEAMGWDHIYYTFAVEIASSDVARVIGFTNISWQTVSEGRSVLILSASLKTWKSVVVDWLEPNAHSTLRQVGTKIYNCFRGASIMQPWAEYGTEPLLDGTLILRR